MQKNQQKNNKTLYVPYSLLVVCFSFIILTNGHTMFIIINNPGEMQFTSPKNGILETKYNQIYKKVNVLKSFWVEFGQFFPLNSGRGIY